MKITNNFNLPLPIVEAVKAQEHKGADYSVTELLNPYQLTVLKRRHAEELTEDASERVWSLFGSALHHVLETGNKDGITEGYLTAQVEGKTVSGTADLYDGETITDYKVTSVWSIIYKSRVIEWTNQLNAYRFLFIKNGFDVKKLQIVALLRDWSKTDALRDPSYPQSQVVVIPIEVEELKDVEGWISETVRELEAIKDNKPDELANYNACSPEERWQTKDVYALMKKGRKSAVKLFDTEEEANRALGEKLGDEVVKRKGVSKRCEDYCPVKAYCYQYNNMIGAV